MNTSERDNQKHATIALRVLQKEPKGLAPTKKEIQQWVEGSLQGERAIELQSWIANVPSYYNVWLELAEKHQEDLQLADTANNEQQKSRSLFETLSHFLNSSLFTPALGGAVAAGLLAVLLVPNLMKSQSIDDLLLDSYQMYGETWELTSLPPLQQQQPGDAFSKGGIDDLFRDAAVRDYVAYHIRLGFRRFLQNNDIQGLKPWKPYITGLPAEYLNCQTVAAADKEACDISSAFFAQVGEWALMNYSVCGAADQAQGAAYWQLQLDTIEAMHQKWSTIQVDIKDKELLKIKNSVFTSKEEVCQVSQAIVKKYI